MAAYYDESKKIWYCKFSYKDWKGKTRFTSKTGFKLKKDALKYEMAYKEKSTAKPNMMLESLAENFLADYKQDRRPSSYKVAEQNIRLHILPYLGDMPIDKITPIGIRKWQAKINTLGKKPSTVYAINTTFQTLLNFAVRYYDLQKNPFSSTGLQGHMEKRTLFLEKAEWDKVDALIENKYDKAVFNMLYCGGMRIGELLALTTRDIDFAQNTVSISKQFSKATNTISPPKTKTSIRKIALPAYCMKYIKIYLDSLINPLEYPFQIIVENTINYRLRKYCVTAGVTPITVHQLRHSHASYLIKQGNIPINAIAQRLGHSPTMTLQTYAHVYKDQDAEIAAMLEQKLNPNQ